MTDFRTPTPVTVTVPDGTRAGWLLCQPEDDPVTGYPTDDVFLRSARGLPHRWWLLLDAEDHAQHPNGTPITAHWAADEALAAIVTGALHTVRFVGAAFPFRAPVGGQWRPYLLTNAIVTLTTARVLAAASGTLRP